MPYSSEETLFEEEFILQLGESEQIIFKLIGIALDKNEIDLGNVKYQLQLPQLFDQQSHLIELGGKTKLHVNVQWCHNEELANLGNLQLRLEKLLKQVDEYNKKITLASNMLKKASSELEKKLQNAQTKQDSSHMFLSKGFSNLPMPMIAENQKFKIQAPTVANLKSM